jgi:hypothetical protein
MEGGALIYTITIDNWLPPTINRLMRMHFARRGKLLSEAATFVACYARLAEPPVPPAWCRRRVTLTLSAPGGDGPKVGDPDARLKVALDALVRAGMLVDDSDEWCELMPRVRLRGEVRTVITLEDLQS